MREQRGASGARRRRPPCPADVKNHGDYVSRVAHDTPPGPDHGKIVSAAAQADCGKVTGAPLGRWQCHRGAGRRGSQAGD